MPWFQLSVAINIVLGVIVVIFAIDRQYFQKTCMLRHNPIDKAIVRIEAKLNELYQMVVEHLKGDKTHG